MPQLLAGGAADFGMGSNGFIPLNIVQQGVPIRAVMATRRGYSCKRPPEWSDDCSTGGPLLLQRERGRRATRSPGVLTPASQPRQDWAQWCTILTEGGNTAR